MAKIARYSHAAVLIFVFCLGWVSPQAWAQLGGLVVSLNSPAPGATVRGTVTVSASVSIVGAVVVTGVQFRLDGADLGAQDTTAPYSIPWNTASVSNGSHTLTAVARDLLGLRYTSDPVTVTVSNDTADTTPPTVRITSPNSGSTVSGTITVTATASDNVGVAGVQFRLDGVAAGAEDIAAPYSMSWNSTAVGNSSHTITAVARDAAGNRTTSAPVTVTVSNQPNDTTPPTVGITSPKSGSTVSGTITVTASAADNVGVAGVQFRLDGVAGGAEDTAAPYSMSWNTTTVGNGSHTITAVARDAAGNRTTSAPVTVTVSNQPVSTPQRFEETDASIAYTAGWSQDETRPWSGGSAALSSTAGARATFTFTGASVDWIGGRGPDTGIARVFVDGVLVSEVDTYSKTAETRVPMFTASGLANARHTFAIEVTGGKNAQASSAVVIVDAFDVPAQTLSRLQETDPAVTYTAGWTQGNTLRAWSAGAAALAATPGAQATFTFNGTAVSWIGARGGQSGIARVSLDGSFVAEIDTYAPTEQIQAAVFTATDLAATMHTLTIEATGRANPAASASLVIVDGFDVASPGTRLQETDPSISYGAGWIQGNRDKAYSDGTSAETNTLGAQATFTFTGTAVGWVGARGPQTGIARVFLDGAFAAEIDTYAPTEGPQHTVFSATGLSGGTHTLRIDVTGRNPAATDLWILIDAFDVSP